MEKTILCGVKMAGKIICSVCGQTHPPAGCKQKVAKRKPQTQKIAALL